MTEQERLDYEFHQKQLHHEASLYESTYVLGELKGMEKGIEKGILITAKNMKKMGIEINVIAQATGLSAIQIADL